MLCHGPPRHRRGACGAVTAHQTPVAAWPRTVKRSESWALSLGFMACVLGMRPPECFLSIHPSIPPAPQLKQRHAPPPPPTRVLLNKSAYPGGGGLTPPPSDPVFIERKNEILQKERLIWLFLVHKPLPHRPLRGPAPLPQRLACDQPKTALTQPCAPHAASRSVCRHWGPSCTNPCQPCTQYLGTCSNGTAGDGTCQCVTNAWSADCSRWCPSTSAAGDVPCSGHGTCDDGATGGNTGACSCSSGYWGADCGNSCPGLGTLDGVCSGFGPGLLRSLPPTPSQSCRQCSGRRTWVGTEHLSVDVFPFSFCKKKTSTSNRRRLPANRHRFASNRRWIPSHRRWLRLKCRPILCLNDELAAGRPDLFLSIFIQKTSCVGTPSVSTEFQYFLGPSPPLPHSHNAPLKPGPGECVRGWGKSVVSRYVLCTPTATAATRTPPLGRWWAPPQSALLQLPCH